MDPRRRRQRRQPGVQRPRRPVRHGAGLDAPARRRRCATGSRPTACRAWRPPTRSPGRPRRSASGARPGSCRSSAPRRGRGAGPRLRGGAGGRRHRVDAAAGVLGDAWPRLVELLGADLARDVFAEATRRLAESILASPRRPPRGRPGHAARAVGHPRAGAGAVARRVRRLHLAPPRTVAPAHEHQVDARLEIARSAGPWWALDGLAIVSERPLVLRRDDRGRPHCADGPAIAWADGLEAFAWHGVAVEPWVIREPGRITVATIDGEPNVEVRRVLVERFGEERLVREGGAELVDADDVGRLWRRRIEEPRRWGPRREEPVVMVEVLQLDARSPTARARPTSCACPRPCAPPARPSPGRSASRARSTDPSGRRR